ncbi:MAG: hypothetical protein OXI07_04750 [Gammaproteobacteria bacterium]|nr:hypothetical protein [Gammaproteobacteria bacterium]
MAVTITADELKTAIRSSASTISDQEGPDDQKSDLTIFVERFLAFGAVYIEKVAPEAPEEVQNEAVIRLAGYELDRGNSSIVAISRQGTIPAATLVVFSNSFRNSGAQALLLPWTQHGAGIVGEEDEP